MVNRDHVIRKPPWRWLGGRPHKARAGRRDGLVRSASGLLARFAGLGLSTIAPTDQPAVTVAALGGLANATCVCG